MFFLIDTCFWLHIQHIHVKLKIDLREVLQHFRWGYTKQIKDEYSNYHLQTFIPVESGFLVPISQQEIEFYQNLYPLIHNLDLPDQTLAFCAKRDGVIALTDDGGLFSEIKSWGLEGFRLPAFCLWLITSGLMRKNTGYKMLRLWEAEGLYEKQEINRWKKELRQIS
ncbi:MAG: hypothetical protein ACTSYI_08530 [Promethearchaeota archaeon]